MKGCLYKCGVGLILLVVMFSPIGGFTMLLGFWIIAWSLKQGGPPPDDFGNGGDTSQN